MESIDEDQRYRREQEEFVSNHGGSTQQEVILVILPNICSILMTSSIYAFIGDKFSKDNRNLLPIIEFIINIIPTVFCCTILSNDIAAVCVSIIIMSLLIFYITIRRSNRQCDSEKHGICNNKKILPFVTNFRALTNILTAVCILAVDFHIFPRRFAKTEIYGYSLMDTGVGLFVIANALVAPETRDFTYHLKISHIRKFISNAENSIKNTAPLLLLGFGRIFAVEYSNYQKHVTEYGVHWNFFITLAFVKLFISTITSAITSRYALLSGIWIIAMHEYALSTQGLKEWVLGNAPRDDFISANREGIISLPGYVGLYLIGIALGRIINSTLWNSAVERNADNAQKHIVIRTKIFGKKLALECNKLMVLCIKLSLVALHACAVTLLCDWYFGVSRRLANSGYCAWILTLSTVVLTLLLVMEILADIFVHSMKKNVQSIMPKRGTNSSVHISGKNISSRRDKHRHVKISQRHELSDNNDGDVEDNGDCFVRKTPEIFQAVNYNGLVFFLFANLLTGIVNMRIKTLHVQPNDAVYLLISYIAICIAVVFLLYRYNLKLKL